MFQYALRRLLLAVPMLLGAMSIVFFAMRVLPGDPCVAMMGDQATTEALADCTRNLGLHRPLAVQYADYLWRSVRLDFGNSLRQGYPVSEYIGRMFPHTFILVMASAVVAVLVGVPIGIVSALKRRNPLLDYPFRLFAPLRLSMPVFWLCIRLLTARAKGQAERAVVYKHALRNMLVPLLTIIGIFVAIALTGTVLTETVFTRPGLGKMLVDAISARDYPLAQGAITVFTMTIILVNLIVDMLYAVVDPRITFR